MNKWHNDNMFPSSGRSTNVFKNRKGEKDFKEKPAFNTGVPGKKGPNRSQGVEKAKIYPNSDGI